ncbi:MAG: hypothetical protein JWQ27_3114 [Ferruginibacter sp.]|nr:hypothetical protein [Ferruginibacter sp.]
MPVIEDITVENLKQFGIRGLSFTMPASTQKWVDQNVDTPSISFDAATLTLQSNTNNWLAPFAGILNEVDTSTKKLQYSLQKADGTMVNEAGAVLRLFPQQVLRMKRLVGLKMEEANTHNPLRATGNVTRQVPAFVFFTSSSASGMTSGFIDAGTDIGFTGSLSFFDEQGFIIHPLYVASLLKSLLAIYPVLDIDTDNTLSNQLAHITGLLSSSNLVRLVKPDGRPYAGGHITGITAVDTAIGLFSINSYTGTDTSLKGELVREAASSAGGSFPPEKARQLLFGNTCYGRLMDKMPLLKLPSALAGNTLSHDFLTVKVVEMEAYLIGAPPAAFNGTKAAPLPAIRLHEPLEMLATGNELMGRIQTIFSGSPTESLCVAIQLDERLPLPVNNTDISWPAFPALPGDVTVTEENNSFPPNLKKELTVNSRADFIPAPGGGQATDVLLKLTGIPLGAAIRVYNRVFGNDAVLKRGDGAGGVCVSSVPPFTGRTLNGELALVLKDPLGLKRTDGTVTVPTDPTLIFELMINLHDGITKRLFGAIQLPVQSVAVTLPAPGAFNVMNAVVKKGVSNAAILGMQQAVNTVVDFSSTSATLNSILALTGEASPRDANRQATMARREFLAAAKKATNWQALISGGQLTAQLHNALPDRGCPGSPGGKETANVGLYTQNGQLAYDIARMAFRRTTSFYQRIVQLSNAAWQEPIAPVALAENSPASATAGTFAGSLLQNIAPFCETPELGLLKSVVETNIDSLPATFDALTDQVAGWINGINTGSLSGLVQTAANRLKTELVTALNTLKDNNALSESDKERLFNELKRELAAACFGRRDTQWALLNAIKQARHSIYIETPGLSFTKGAATADYAADLIAELNTQCAAKPGLRVIICVPRQPDYQRQYDQWIQSEIKERFTIIQSLPQKQVVAFHPIGFPGRPANLEQQVLIVDDSWCLCGSSAFRRRGLTFDGSSDLVFTDIDQVNGQSRAIAGFRKELMSQRLGINAGDTTSSRALQLNNFHQAFALVRQTLISGGLGKIERVWNGHTDGVTFSEPSIDRELANPDGIEFNGLQALVFAAFATLPK